MDRIGTAAHRLELAVLLRGLRVESRLRQQDVAGRLRVSQSFVSKYESGQLALDIAQLRLVCAALGVPLARVLELWERRLRESDP